MKSATGFFDNAAFLTSDSIKKLLSASIGKKGAKPGELNNFIDNYRNLAMILQGFNTGNDKVDLQQILNGLKD